MDEATRTTTTTATADTTPDVTPVKAKKKTRHSVPYGLMYVQASFNNTMITLTDKKGNKLAGSSAGACGFRGSKKGTAYAAQVASEKALQLAKNDYGLSKVDVFVNGIGLGRESAIRALQSVDIVVESITDKTTIPHGGVRPKKPRRG